MSRRAGPCSSSAFLRGYCRSAANVHAELNDIELQQDPLIRSHLSVLYDTLLEQNLVRVIEPYSAVELSYVAQEVGQSLTAVEEK